MKLTIRIDAWGEYGHWVAATEVPELYRRCFAPLHTGDGSVFSVLAGDVSDAEAQIIYKTREDAAKILAKELSEFLVKAMKKNDTYNGYELDHQNES